MSSTYVFSVSILTVAWPLVEKERTSINPPSKKQNKTHSGCPVPLQCTFLVKIMKKKGINRYTPLCIVLKKATNLSFLIGMANAGCMAEILERKEAMYFMCCP